MRSSIPRAGSRYLRDTDVWAFVDAWRKGKVKYFHEFTATGDPLAWGYLRGFPEDQPEIWASFVISMKAYKSMLKRLRVEWKEYNQDLPRREKVTFAEYIQDLKDGVYGTSVNFHDTKDAIDQHAYLLYRFVNWRLRYPSDSRAPRSKWDPRFRPGDRATPAEQWRR